MPIPVIPRGSVPLGKNPEFFKFVCPPGNPPGQGPIDPVTANFSVSRNLDIHGMLDLPAGVFTFEGNNKIDLWLIEDPNAPAPKATFPARTIRIPRGSVVHATAGFQLNTHTIHWHGIEPTPMNDGVGHTSFEVSGNWIYQFQPNTAGTYFYHCHKNTVLHFEMGLYGLLLIDPPAPAGSPLTPPYTTGGPGFASANAPTIPGFDQATFTIPYDVEAAWVPDEFDSRWHVLGHNAFMQACDPNDPVNPALFDHTGILNDFQPDIFLISGVVSVPDPTQPLPPGVLTPPPFGIGAPITDPAVAVTAQVGQNILIRLLNAGYTIQEYTLGIDATVIGEDGHPLGVPPVDQYSSPFVVHANTPFRLTTAMRWDLVVTPTAAGTFPFIVKYISLNNGELFHVAQTTITVTPYIRRLGRGDRETMKGRRARPFFYRSL